MLKQNKCLGRDNCNFPKLARVTGHYLIRLCHYKVRNYAHAPPHAPQTVDRHFMQRATLQLATALEGHHKKDFIFFIFHFWFELRHSSKDLRAYAGKNHETSEKMG